MFSNKTIGISTIFTGLTFGGTLLYLWGVGRAGRKMVVQTTFDADFTAQGVVLIIRPVLKNPTNAIFEVGAPFVSLSFEKKGAAFASSTPENKKYTVPANGQIALDAINITIPWINTPELVRMAKAGEILFYTKTAVQAYIARPLPFSINIEEETKQSIPTAGILGLIMGIFKEKSLVPVAPFVDDNTQNQALSGYTARQKSHFL